MSIFSQIKGVTQPGTVKGNPDPVVFVLPEVERGIAGLTCNKAPGPDGIPPDLFKSNPGLWAPVLLAVINAAARTGCPDAWGVSTIVPVFKKGDRNSTYCYRPISLLDSVVKVVGGMVLERLRSWAKANKILTDIQYGFRSGCSTHAQCLNLYMIIGKYTMARQGTIYMAFMDLSSAFDCVNRTRLWESMRAMGVDDNLIKFLKDIHCNTTANVRYAQDLRVSRVFNINRGVRQGCILAPFLFNLYINNLEEDLIKTGADFPYVGRRGLPVLLYADDAVLISRTSKGLQILLESFSRFVRTGSNN